MEQLLQELARVIDREMKVKVDNVAQIFVSLSFQEFFTGRERQADGLSRKRTCIPPSVDDLRMLIPFLNKNQLCCGGILTIRLPECHANQNTWSDADQTLFDKVRQFILELVKSFGLQAHKALALADNLTWRGEGSP